MQRVGLRKPFDAHVPRPPSEEAHVTGVAAEIDESVGIGLAVQDVPRADRDVPGARVDERGVEMKTPRRLPDLPAPPQPVGKPIFRRADTNAVGIDTIGASLAHRIVQPEFLSVNRDRSGKTSERQHRSRRVVQVNPAVSERPESRQVSFTLFVHKVLVI